MYSHRDFTGRTLIEHEEIDGQIIKGACFSQETPDTHIFPEDITGVTFQYCNLDNCFIPPGNIVENCSQRRFISDAAGDWLIDAENNIIGPLNG